MAWFKALNTATQGFLLTVFAAAAGRVMYHTREVQAGRRRFWSWNLLGEAPIAVGMGLIAAAIGDYLGLTEIVSRGVACFIAFLGPPLLQDGISFVREFARVKAGLPPKE